MIYDIVNAIVYVILAQMFCSTFLKREQHSSMIYGVITIIWIISVFIIGTICESTLLLRIVLIVLLSILISLILYKKNNIAMTVVIPILYNTLGFACEFFIVCIHRFLDPGLVIEQVMDSKISIYMGIVSQLLQCILILVLRKAFWKTKTTEISTKLWIIYMIFPVYSLSVIILIAYSFNETINTFQMYVFIYIAMSLLLINLFIYWFIKQESQRALAAQKNRMEIVHAKGIMQLYEQITKERDILGKREHEFKNTISALQGLFADKQYDRMKEILDVQNAELINNTNVFETGNRLINTILNTKYAEAREKGIVFRFVINDLSSLKIEDRDCIVILTNILNNAIEATEKCIPENRLVSVKAVIEDGQFIFACRNTYENDHDPEIKSNKKDIISHGYGIKNIKEAISRNKGHCYFEKEEKEFVAVAIIPM